LSFFETVEGIRSTWIRGFIGVDEEGLIAVSLLDVTIGNTRLEI
jgi:hypothetical protein